MHASVRPHEQPQAVPPELATTIDRAGAPASLARAAGEIRANARNMLAQGMGAEALTASLASLNERLTGRILALEAARHELGGIRLCWLGLGSEARREQTFASDQDNAIIFDSELSADAARARSPFQHAQCPRGRPTYRRCGALESRGLQRVEPASARAAGRSPATPRRERD